MADEETKPTEEPDGKKITHLKVDIAYPFGSNTADENGDARPLLRKFVVPGRGIRLMPDSPANRVRLIGKCIYCGTEDLDDATVGHLTEEHVIAEALGARLILEQASCRACAKLILKYEGRILGTLLQTARRQLGVRSKKRLRKNDYPITVVVDEQDQTIRVPLDKHPTFLFLPFLDVPGILLEGGSETRGMTGAWTRQLNSHQPILEMGFNNFTSPVLDTLAFCQFLAKTAHGLAVAEYGLDGFTPCLTEFIRSDIDADDPWPDRFNFIGGHGEYYAESEELHLAGFMLLKARDRIFLGVHMRLFACYGAPVYLVVVGEIGQEQLGKFPVVTGFREHMVGRNPGQTDRPLKS
jgi:hypothetical protein